MIALSLLDQSPIPSGSDATSAFANTLELAQRAEELGYRRYWVAEHHGTNSLAGSAPEVLIAHIAAQTSRIRVGSGGVMLPHYSALKVAEQFHVLATLYPGRIDLGIGRAPGGDRLASIALQRNRQHPADDDFLDQMAELLAWFDNRFSPEHPFSRMAPTPIPRVEPDLWLLSSSGYSAATAAHFGAGISWAHFINADGGPEALAHYRENFIAVRAGDEPRASVALGVICADTDEEAEILATSSQLRRLRSRLYGDQGPIPSVEEARNYPYTDGERKFLTESANAMIIGGPARVRQRIEEYAHLYGVDEVVVVTITHDHKARIHSYELLAEAFDLRPAEMP
jgi:luciferase family oxidoreductase group 1